MRILSLISFVVAIFAIVACSTDETAPDMSASSLIHVSTAISPELKTRNVVNGTAFPSGSTIGLFICKHEEGTPSTFAEYNSKLNNLYAIQTSDDTSAPVWNYKYQGTGTQFAQLYLLMPQTGEKAADFYAYAPWISGVTAPTSIPFSLSQCDNNHSYATLPDILYCSENATGINKNRTPDGNDIDVSFHFQHLLSRLKINFYLTNDDNISQSDGNSYNRCTIDNIVLRRKGSTPLYDNGTFNAISGVLSMNSSDNITVKYGLKFGTKGINYSYNSTTKTSTTGSCYMLLYPVTMQSDNDYELVFTIDGKTLETTYPIKLSDIKDNEGNVRFRAGYTYTFTFIYDNYHHIRLSNTQIDDEDDWTDDELSDITI